MMELTENDPTYPLFLELQKRGRLNPIEKADKTFELFIALHKTEAEHRKPLNGGCRAFIIQNLGISKALLSQYLSIHNKIKSEKVKQRILEAALSGIHAYRVSAVCGKNATETESIQLAKIEELIKNRRLTIYHRKRGVRM